MVKQTVDNGLTGLVNRTRLNSNFDDLYSHVGGHYVDTTDQPIAVINTPQAITFNDQHLHDNITHTNGTSLFTVTIAGTYTFTLAPQVGQGGGSATVEFWLTANAVDIPNSGVQITVAANSEQLPIIVWKQRFAVNDVFEAVWASDSTNTSLDAITSLFTGSFIPSCMLAIDYHGE